MKREAVLLISLILLTMSAVTHSDHNHSEKGGPDLKKSQEGFEKLIRDDKAKLIAVSVEVALFLIFSILTIKHYRQKGVETN